jgi:hypothetical protein
VIEMGRTGRLSMTRGLEAPAGKRNGGSTASVEQAGVSYSV